MHARASGIPYFAYGPTVVATAFVRPAMAASASASWESATITGQSTPMEERSSPSRVSERPASPMRAPSGACFARYWAVSRPTKPVAP